MEIPEPKFKRGDDVCYSLSERKLGTIVESSYVFDHAVKKPHWRYRIYAPIVHNGITQEHKQETVSEHRLRRFVKIDDSRGQMFEGIGAVLTDDMP